MAHTEDPDPIIPQKPPPPPDRDAGDRAPEERAPAGPPTEAPQQQMQNTPRVASAPASRRRARESSGHLVIPARESDPEIISHGAARPRMSTSPALMLIDYPRDRVARAISRHNPRPHGGAAAR